MEKKPEYFNLKLLLGATSLIVGLLSASFAVFGWAEQIKPQIMFGIYSRYVCAFGGFGAMILGAMLVNDFLVMRRLTADQAVSRPIAEPQIDFLVGLKEQEEAISAK